MNRSSAVCAVAIVLVSAIALGKGTLAAPSEDVERITGEAERTYDKPILILDRPIYRALQQSKNVAVFGLRARLLY